jgi:hypothetical protein
MRGSVCPTSVTQAGIMAIFWHIYSDATDATDATVTNVTDMA